MKDYVDYMNSITVTADLHDKILKRTSQNPVLQLKTKTRSFHKYTAPLAIAAACLVVFGYSLYVMPKLLDASDEKKADEPVSSMIFEPTENFKTGETDQNGERLSGEKELTLEQALSDADFGAYVSTNVPSRFIFASSQKSTDQVGNYLSVLWKDETGDNDGCIVWRVSKSAADENARIVYVQEREKYDTTLYSFPWDKSVPEEILRYFENPVFLSEELTLDTLQARSYHADNIRSEAHDLQMDFSVLYGDVVVLVNTKGASPEQLYEMLNGLGKSQATYKEFQKTDNLASTDDN